jgi:N-acetylglucosamine kinase-like BadF-type ATPase
MPDPHPLGLGLDAGGSATRWALSDPAGTILAAGEAAPITGHIYAEPERARMRDAALAIRAALPRAPARLVAGITGISATAPEAVQAAAILAAALGLPAPAVKIEDDIWIACHAAFPPGAGHVVYAGTGSIGAHLAADGTILRVGGRGMLIDDAGSAFWIGREALAHVWRARDTDPAHASPLAAALDAAIGGPGWDEARAYVYGGGRNAVAQLARAVAAADDPAARRILARAGAELARLAQALVTLAGPRPIALMGRAAALHPAIAQGFRAAVPHLHMSLAQPDAAAAAARLAAGAPAAQAPAEKPGEQHS